MGLYPQNSLKRSCCSNQIGLTTYWNEDRIEMKVVIEYYWSMLSIHYKICSDLLKITSTKLFKYDTVSWLNTHRCGDIRQHLVHTRGTCQGFLGEIRRRLQRMACTGCRILIDCLSLVMGAGMCVRLQNFSKEGQICLHHLVRVGFGCIHYWAGNLYPRASFFVMCLGVRGGTGHIKQKQNWWYNVCINLRYF